VFSNTVKAGFSTQTLRAFRSRYITPYGQQFTVWYVNRIEGEPISKKDEVEMHRRFLPYHVSGELYDAKYIPNLIADWGSVFGAGNIKATSAENIRDM
jgi:hypothetical protein